MALWPSDLLASHTGLLAVPQRRPQGLCTYCLTAWNIFHPSVHGGIPSFPQISEEATSAHVCPSALSVLLALRRSLQGDHHCLAPESQGSSGSLLHPALGDQNISARRVWDGKMNLHSRMKKGSQGKYRVIAHGHAARVRVPWGRRGAQRPDVHVSQPWRREVQDQGLLSGEKRPLSL